MNEEKILEQLRQSAEQVEAPDSLKPENIIQQLPQRKDWRKAYRMGAVAASVCIFVLGIALLGKTGLLDGGKSKTAGAPKATADVEEPPVTAEAEPEAEESVQDVQSFTTGPLKLYEVASPASGYQEIYDHIASYYETMYKQGSYTGLDSATYPEDITNYEESFYNMEQLLMFTETSEYERDAGQVYECDGTYAYLAKSDGSVVIMDASSGVMGYVSAVSGNIHEMESFMEIHVIENKLIRITSYIESSDPTLGTFKEGTMVYTYDITDKAVPVLTGTVDIEGYYMGSRLTDTGIYVYTSCNKYDYMDLSGNLIPMEEMEPNAYVPSVNGAVLSSENVYVAAEVSNTSYVVCASVSLDSPGEILDAKAFLSFDSQYVPGESGIYLLLRDNLYNSGAVVMMRLEMTDGQIIPSAAGAAEGFVRSVYAINEKNGYLSIVTCNSSQTETKWMMFDKDFRVAGSKYLTSDIHAVNSVRYIDDKVYLAVSGEHPLVVLHIENTSILTETAHDKLEGFEGNLYSFGECRVLGVSYVINKDTAQYEGVRLTMFDTSDPSDIRVLHTQEVVADTTPAVNDPDALFVDVAQGLIGLAVEDWNEDYTQNHNQYYLYRYQTDSGFLSMAEIPLSEVNCWYTRGFVLGNTFYLAERDGGIVRSFDMTNGYAQTGEVSY